MSVRKFVLPTIAIAASLATGVGVASATGVTKSATTTKSKTTPAKVNQSDQVYLAASLLGRNEVPVQGGPAVGDQDGRATAVVRIQGDQLWYALRWKNVAPPNAGHIHLGVRGTNGGVKIGFFAGALPATARAVSGSVKVTDQATLNALRTDPTGFYANLHTAEFPGGAVRGQFHKLNKPVDLNGVLNGSSALTLQSQADGAQELPNPEGKATGDPDGRSTALVRAHGSMVTWGFTWSAISQPTVGHIHKGAKGTNGPVAADLFDAPGGLPAGVTGLAGMSPAQATFTHRIMHNPAGYYSNLHTAEFPGGAVRGQFTPVTSAQPRAVNAPVILGAQIYRCTQQPNGTFAFAQNNVAAVLSEAIRHSFVTPEAGPPQWIAPDGSAVTGKLVTKTPNGTAIPELVLDATQSGANTGLLSGASQILRLNTLGGAAPTGACDPQQTPFAKVRYQADYLFLG